MQSYARTAIAPFSFYHRLSLALPLSLLSIYFPVKGPKRPRSQFALLQKEQFNILYFSGVKHNLTLLINETILLPKKIDP
jgi:hypothetical protein